jgi:hypothetical protein
VQHIPDNSAQYANENAVQLAKVIALHILILQVPCELCFTPQLTFCIQQTVSQGRTACSWLHFDRPIFIHSGGTAFASSADQR